MENMLVAFNCVLPIFIWLMTGYIAKRANVIPKETYPVINRFNFHVLLLMLLFTNTYHANFRVAFQPRVIVAVVGFIIALMVGGMLVTCKMSNHRRRGAYVQAIYRSNIATVGVALMQNMGDTDGCAMMAIIVAFTAPLLNILAVIALELCRGEKAKIGKLLTAMAKNPIIIGSVAGTLANLVGLPIPANVDKALTQMGTAGMVLSLIVLGATLEFTSVAHSLRPIFIGTAARLVIAPLICVPLSILMGFRGTELACIMLSLATPQATNSYIMSQVYDSDHELTGQLVMVTSLAGCFTLFLWITALKSLCLI